VITKRKSSHSAESANCVALWDFGDEVALGDTKGPNWQMAWFDRAAWTDFVQAVGRGEFDRPRGRAAPSL
jgi:hypothetical protein